MEKADRHKITVTHINIRESISILLLKLLTLDVIGAVFTILFFSLVSFTPSLPIADKILSFNTLFFVLLGLFKVSFTIYIILLWLNEYFEITPEEVIHKRGLIWRYEKRYKFEYVRAIKMYQGLVGSIFNFGTIALYDLRRNKRVELYQIHNPKRFLRILEHLIDNPHIEKHTMREHVYESEREWEDNENNPPPLI